MLKKMSLKKMSRAAAVVGAFSLMATPLITSIASAQGNSTEPPKAPSPSEAGAMSKGGGGAMMKKSGGGAMMKKSKGGGMMMKKSHGKKM